jgi:hypothetical protein
MRGPVWIPIAVSFLFVLYGVVGASSLAPLVKPASATIPFGGESNTDLFLGALGLAHSAAPVEKTFQRWDKNTEFLFVAPANHPFWVQTYYTLTYLAYPRRISAVACAEKAANQNEIHRELSPNMDGLIFFDVPPGRWATGAQQIGSKLFIAPYHGSPAWKSFCP